MKILIASDLHYPTINGVATFSRNLARGMAARGHEVLVIAPSQTGRRCKEVDDNYVIVRTDSVPFPFYQNFRISLYPALEVKKIINGFEDGAKSVNPDLVVETAWTNSFVDSQLALEAATAMIEDGVDVIKHCANACGNGAISAAVDAGIWCQGDSYDQSSLAPKNILDSALYNLDVVLDIALGSVADGSFTGDVYNLGMADNAVAVLLSDNLPAEVAATAQQAIDDIISGKLVVVRDYVVRN